MPRGTASRTRANGAVVWCLEDGRRVERHERTKSGTGFAREPRYGLSRSAIQLDSSVVLAGDARKQLLDRNTWPTFVGRAEIANRVSNALFCAVCFELSISLGFRPRDRANIYDISRLFACEIRSAIPGCCRKKSSKRETDAIRVFGTLDKRQTSSSCRASSMAIGILSPVELMFAGDNIARRRSRGSRSRCRGILTTSALFLACFSALVPLTAAKRGPRIPDDLENVVDSEEDEAFKAWGQRKVKEEGLPKTPQGGAQLAFARLTPDPTGERTLDDVNVIASRWATLLRSGGMSETVYAVDDSTVLISLPDGNVISEVREFLWSQAAVQSFEWNSQVWLKGEDRPTPRKFDAKKPRGAAQRKKRRKGVSEDVEAEPSSRRNPSKKNVSLKKRRKRPGETASEKNAELR